MRIGFTGTRKGMTKAQQKAFIHLFVRLSPTEFHHGGAKGADHQAHLAVWPYRHRIDVHPSTLEMDLRSGCFAQSRFRLRKPPLVRNRDIVDETDVLIATPEGEEVQRSGTWSTVRYARKVDKPRVIIYPDGRVVWEKEVPNAN